MIAVNQSKDFPFFIVAGMPRGGTTFLYHNLNKHPRIFLPFRKEVNFFNVRYDLGVQWYNDLYREREENQVCGDISPNYFSDRKTIRKIREHKPGAKVILSVRDPVDYALSFYSQFHSFTFNMPPFDEFLKGYENKLNGKTLGITFKNNYIIDTLKLFMSEFGENILLFDFSLIERDSLMVLQAIERFIGVPAFFQRGNYDDVKINASGRKNIKLLTSLLHQEWLISFIQKIFPRRLIIFSRNKFDKVSAGKSPSGSAPRPYTEADVKLAETELADQRAGIKRLFEKSPLITGSGAPFPARGASS